MMSLRRASGFSAPFKISCVDNTLSTLHDSSSSTLIERILVVGPAWVGDMVMAQSLFKTLKQRQPQPPTIDVLAPFWSHALLARMAEVDNALALPLKHGQLGLGTRYRLGRRLQADGYEQAILLPNSFKSALVPYWAKIPRRTGFLGEQRWGLVNDIRPLDKTQLPMTVQRFVALGLERDAALPPPVAAPTLQPPAEEVEAALTRLGLQQPAQPLLGLCPGAEYGPAKRWPADYFLEISRAMQSVGWAVWIFGSAKDSAIGRWLASRGGGVDLTGKTSLAEAVDLLSLTRVVVSNDSGLMHVAAALERPIIALYGSSDPNATPPLSAKAKILSLGLTCSPCFQRRCPLQHLRCLRDLAPQQVLAAVEDAVA